MGFTCRVVAKGGCVVGNPYTSAFRSIFLISLSGGGLGLVYFRLLYQQKAKIRLAILKAVAALRNIVLLRELPIC